MKTIKTILKTTALVALLLTAEGCSRKNTVDFSETREISRVDSVWVKRPGEINTMQVDFIYFFRTTKGEVHQSRVPVHVGDSLIYIFRRKIN